MRLSDDDLDSFIEAYRKDTGETLSRDEAFDAAHRVLGFFRVMGEIAAEHPELLEDLGAELGDPPPPQPHTPLGDEPGGASLHG